MTRLLLIAFASLILTAAYGVLAVCDRELAGALAWLYVLPLLTALALSKPR